MSQGEVEGGVDTPMEGGLMEKPRLRGRRGGRRRMDEIRGERGVGGGAPCCGSRQSACWTVRACARGQRVARGLWVWLIYSWKQARNFDWNPTGFCLVPAGPPGRYFSTKARPAKSGKKFTGPKLGLNGGCFAIVSYIQDQLDETHRLATFGQLWKNHPPNRQAGVGPRRPCQKKPL